MRSSAGRSTKIAGRAPRPVPRRTCVACRTERPKGELVRVVRAPQARRASPDEPQGPQGQGPLGAKRRAGQPQAAPRRGDQQAGALSVDLRGKVSGRGAYLCPDPACLERGLAQGSLARALEVEIDGPTRERLHSELTEGMRARDLRTRA